MARGVHGDAGRVRLHDVVEDVMEDVMEDVSTF